MPHLVARPKRTDADVEHITQAFDIVIDLENAVQREMRLDVRQGGQYISLYRKTRKWTFVQGCFDIKTLHHDREDLT
jgi:hypothetical protein